MAARSEELHRAREEEIAPPSKLWLLLEGRAAGELATTLALRPLLRRLSRGDGHPVLILPGFLAGDFSTRPLRRFLRDLDYHAHRWELGRNLGPQGDLEERMSERLDQVYRKHERRVSIVGWSLGGVYARALANRHSDQVRSVITLGSPFARDTKANNSVRLFEMITKERLDEIDSRKLAEVRRTPPVPTTSVFSRTDGVTAWQTSIETEGPQAESIEVPGSHLGLGFNPLVLYVVADRLMQPENSWKPFFRPGVAHLPGIRRPAEARKGAPEETPEGASGGASGGAPEETPEGASEGASEETREESRAGASER